MVRRTFVLGMVCVWCWCQITHAYSYSFFMPRQISSDSTYELALTNYEIFHVKGQDFPCTLFVKPFYQRSIKSRALAAYFLPNNSSCARVRQDGLGDICSIWLGLMGSYDEDEENNTISQQYYTSGVTICPVRTAGGAQLQCFFDLHRALPYTWLSLNTAVVHVRHAMNLHEASTCLGAVDNIKTFLDAFNNPEWTAGKIADGWLTQDGLDDIYIKLGYDLVRTLKKHIGLYACTSIPTGNKPCSCYLFEPLVGTVHARIGGGLNASVLFADHDNRQWTVLTDVRYCYAFANNERRSFDLTCNGDWSRYLLLVTEAQQFNTLPAINLCTHDVRVTLGSTIDLWAALHYEHAQHHIEVGYNFWWRDRESINMCTTCFCDNYYIYNLASGCDPALSCSPTANISQSVDGTNAVSSTTSCTPLKSTDLNSCSAAHPRTHTHKIYGALAYHGKQHDFPVMMGLGISYEFAPRIYVRANCWPRKIKTALEQWAVWCSFGAAF